ncbi:thiamine ABC transporter ATP-binding protein [Aureimonas sp. AU40]|uniref:thiamine ABC transporter ATP-binding protein n=1 Tax=Aureimonas sp. AU40 TaxID=1637747 RepID=UPI000783AC38|nr:thiamine ABC transporter ATP-binding protein [Aureimonas sp. AU40]
MTAIELRGVTHRYEGVEMRFDLAVGAGEWLALIGPSGAGKSTLLDLVAGFLRPESGTVRLQGVDRTRDEPATRPISMMFQDNNLFAHLTAEENVAIGIEPRARLGRAARERARSALAEVGLEGFAKRRPSDMSGGERQRVALARVILRERPILLLDEPFAALGPALRAEMLALVASLRTRSPRPPTIVMVTHHPDDARGFADRLAFLEDGHIRLTGPVAELLDRSADSRLRAYLGERAPPREGL